ITREGYDKEHFIKLIAGLRERHPNLEIIIEPGSAFTWQTGDLITKVLDVVENAGIKTGIIDASFACHMPDCLEMPYRPAIGEALPDDAEGEDVKVYRLGGNSCLSGDYVSDWKFDGDLKAGDILTLKDMNHYTTVKTNMFNGIQHPSIWLQDSNGEKHLLREYTYDDYRRRMD
ncbi:MAG: carboxynorspermidine decarboxylase, partial [Muribaculaceae bacterium]|nr:carboxynorspermidine decarboxylase [Muribaculaceae bacterium]